MSNRPLSTERRALRAHAYASTRYASRGELYAARAAEREAYKNQWHRFPGHPNLRRRDGWVWTSARCNTCRKIRYWTLRFATQLAIRRKRGGWLIRSKFISVEHKPRWRKPSTDCRCRSRSGPLVVLQVGSAGRFSLSATINNGTDSSMEVRTDDRT
jgi:hypothetical protein